MIDARSNRRLIAAASAFTILWFAMLGGRALYDPDEGRYAEIPREMLHDGDWVTPHLDGFAYLEKPPLQYWITAASLRVFGENEWAARLGTGIAGYLSLVLVFALARRLWDFETAIKASFYCGGSILFVLLGHQLTLDMSLTSFLFAALGCFLFAQLRRDSPAACRRWMLGCWVAMAFAVLTKGLIGALIPAFTLGAYLVWQRDFAVLATLNLRWGLPLFAAISVPWFALAARANPTFLWFFFIREHFQRFLTPIAQRTEPWWFFIPVLLLGVLPWASRAVQVVAGGWRAAVPRGRFDPRRVLWIWSVFVLVFFSLSDSKLVPYILPAIPALALLAAAPSPGGGRAHVSIGAASTLAAAAGLLLYAGAIWGSSEGRALAIALRPSLIVTAAILVACALAALLFSSRRRALAASCALGTGWFCAAIAITVGAAEVQRFFSAKDIAAALRANAPPAAPIFSVQTFPRSLPFYLGRTVTLAAYHDEFALGQSLDPGRAIADLRQFSGRWAALDEGYAVMPSATYERLRAQGEPMRKLAGFSEDDTVLVSRR